MSVSHTNSATFAQDVLEADKPVLVDFWAEWCGPCRMMSPVLDEFASKRGDDVTVLKVNVDENPDLANQFGIMSIPTLMFFKDGKAVNTIVGTTNIAGLDRALTSL